MSVAQQAPLCHEKGAAAGKVRAPVVMENPFAGLREAEIKPAADRVIGNPE
jgi:hypothetical protein